MTQTRPPQVGGGRTGRPPVDGGTQLRPISFTKPELAELDELVAEQRASRKEGQPYPSRSSVIRELIHQAHRRHARRITPAA